MQQKLKKPQHLTLLSGFGRCVCSLLTGIPLTLAISSIAEAISTVPIGATDRVLLSDFNNDRIVQFRLNGDILDDGLDSFNFNNPATPDPSIAGVFAKVPNPLDLKFGPQGDDNLYVLSDGLTAGSTSKLYQFDLDNPAAGRVVLELDPVLEQRPDTTFITETFRQQYSFTFATDALDRTLLFVSDFNEVTRYVQNPDGTFGNGTDGSGAADGQVLNLVGFGATTGFELEGDTTGVTAEIVPEAIEVGPDDNLYVVSRVLSSPNLSGAALFEKLDGPTSNSVTAIRRFDLDGNPTGLSGANNEIFVASGNLRRAADIAVSGNSNSLFFTSPLGQSTAIDFDTPTVGDSTRFANPNGGLGGNLFGIDVLQRPTGNTVFVARGLDFFTGDNPGPQGALAFDEDGTLLNTIGFEADGTTPVVIDGSLLDGIAFVVAVPLELSAREGLLVVGAIAIGGQFWKRSRRAQ